MTASLPKNSGTAPISDVRYAAFLRGVSPLNCKMADLRRCLESAGFDGVATVLSSGNAVLTSTLQCSDDIAHMIEATMNEHLDRVFGTFVRPIEYLEQLLARDPFSQFNVPKGAKRVVTFLRHQPRRGLRLPIESDGASILGVSRGEAFTAYTPTPTGPVFMKLLEDTFGKDITTRTWDTVRKVVAKACVP